MVHIKLVVGNAVFRDLLCTETCLQRSESTLQLPASNKDYHYCYESIRLASPISDLLPMQHNQYRETSACSESRFTELAMNQLGLFSQ